MQQLAETCECVGVWGGGKIKVKHLQKLKQEHFAMPCRGLLSQGTAHSRASCISCY